MAVISATDFASLRRDIQPGDWTASKAQFNSALQAVEDFFENTGRAAIGNAIETAVPGVFTAAQKKRIVKFWLRFKFGLE